MKELKTFSRTSIIFNEEKLLAFTDLNSNTDKKS